LIDCFYGLATIGLFNKMEYIGILFKNRPMKRRFYLLVLFSLGLIYCNSGKSTNDSLVNKDSANKTVSDTIKNESEKATNNQANIQSIAFPENLKKYLTVKQIDSFELAAKQYNNIKTSADLAAFYIQTLPKILDFIRQGIQKSNPYNPSEVSDNVWYSFRDYMPFIMVDAFSSESDEIWPVVNLFPLYKLAKQTTESDDDIYFKLAIEMYGVNVDKDSLIYENLDVTWATMDFENMIHSSNLGENIIYKLLKLSEQSLNAGKAFEAKTYNCRDLFLPNKELFYRVSKNQALAEIDKILKDCKLNDKERKQILETQLDIKTNAKIQFNCKDGNCVLNY